MPISSALEKYLFILPAYQALLFGLLSLARPGERSSFLKASLLLLLSLMLSLEGILMITGTGFIYRASAWLILALPAGFLLFRVSGTKRFRFAGQAASSRPDPEDARQSHYAADIHFTMNFLFFMAIPLFALADSLDLITRTPVYTLIYNSIQVLLTGFAGYNTLSGRFSNAAEKSFLHAPETPPGPPPSVILREPGPLPLPGAPGKYAASPLDDDRKEEILVRVERLMLEKKLFTDRKLTLSKLSRKLRVNQKYISQAVNERHGLNFYQYLNRYRTDEAEKILADPSQAGLSVEEVGRMAGFQSKSSFHTAFRKSREMTPAEFRRNKGKTPDGQLLPVPGK